MPECRSRSDHNGRKWENFPAGLRVLVVDDDSLCLKVIEQMLRSCKYEVTTCMSSTKALEMLRERRSDFDLVLSDVFMPDIDGFKLLETIGLELQLPVIMMSSSGETNVVLRGVTHGAVDFLIKPVRVEELRNVWQHVVRRRKELGKDIEVAERPRLRDEVSNGDLSRKRKENSKDWKGEEGYATKKPRVNWSVEMHQQFVNAVNQLGIDKAVPKKILELMSVKGLTRENVASHLQKYRLYLKRMRGVQTTGIQPRLASASQPQQNASEMPSTGAVSQAVPPTPPGVFPAAVPGPPGVLGSVPQAIGSLVPALGPLGSNPNLANMQLQLQNMHLQGALSLGGSLDANTLVQLAGGFPPGLGVGMGSLQAHALMNMGLMAGVHGGNGPQFQGLQLGMSRSASVPVGGGVMDMSNRQLRRNNSAVAGSTELAKQGLSCERVRDPGPATLLSSVSEEAMPSMMPAIRGFDLGILSVGAYAGQQGKTESTSPTGNRAQLDLQVKKEDAGARPSTLQLSSCDNLEVGMLEPQGIAREVDAATATGFPVDEQLGVIGTAVNGDLGHFAAGDYVPFGDGSGVPVEETKDMGMDEFLNAFLRETSVSNDSAGQC